MQEYKILKFIQVCNETFRFNYNMKLICRHNIFTDKGTRKSAISNFIQFLLND